MTRSFHNAVVGFNHILAEPTHVFSEKGSEEMKRKILSLLLVFVLLCGMLPAALADGTNDTNGDGSETHEHKWEYTQANGKHSVSCTIEGCSDTKPEEACTVSSSYEHDANKHWKVCSVCGGTARLEESNHDFTNGDCVCGEKAPKTEPDNTVKGITLDKNNLALVVNETSKLTATLAPTGASGTVDWSSSDETVATVSGGTVTAKAKGTAVITAKVGEIKAVCNVTVKEAPSTDTNKLTISAKKTTLSGKNDSTTISASFTNNGADLKDIKWSTSNDDIYISGSGSSVTVYAETNSSSSATITAKLKFDGKTYEDSVKISISNSADIDISATVYNSNTGYALGDKDDAGNKSVVDKITAELSNKDYIKYVQFDSVSEKNKGSLSCRTKDQLDEDELAEVEFEPDEDFVGYVSFNFTLETKYETYDGVLTFNVKKGTASNAKGDISYTGTRGGTVYFDARDFEDYFEDEYPRGELEYVTFSRASNGTVYYDGKKISTSDEFYANPGKRDKDLDEVYYEPSSDTYTGTATVSFTAYGENSSGTSKSTSGVISIVYSSANAKDISYQATNGSVRLNADDFISTYKKATGVTSSNPTMYIRFTKLPSKGNLYVNYTSNGGGSRVSTSTYYSSKSSASNYIGDITYAADAAGGTETVEYTAYSTDSTSGLKYSGKIVFTANATNNTVPTTPVNISYTCTGGSVKFSNADFSGSSSSMMLIDYLVFGTPSTGALYTNYAGGTGNAVTSGQRFDYVGITSLGTTAVSSVSYVPPMGWSGTASVPFSAYLIGGGTITGTVTISVTAAATTVLRDVRTTDWYAAYVTDLLAAGVLTGYEDNTFRAANNVTYGEILKLVMLATGYAEQSKSGAHWASGYVDRALTDGILTERVDPDAYASRAAVADIAARAMRLSPVTDGVNPFTDSVNGYARALYNAGIITGYEEGGRTYYRGGNPIERAHIAAIICRIMDYTGKAPSQPSTTPTPPRTDVEIPDWLRS